MAIDLHVESTVGRRTLGAARIVRIEEALRITLPLEIAPRCRALDPGYDLERFLAVRGREHVHVARLASALGERDSHVFAVRRWTKPVDRCVTAHVERVGINQ